MARRHHKDSPVVKDFLHLYLRDHPDIAPILLDSPQWFAWLVVADMFSFVTENKDLTVRKEKRGKNQYWYLAGADTDGKTHKVYLGKSEGISAQKLRNASEKLLASIQV